MGKTIGVVLVLTIFLAVIGFAGWIEGGMQ